MKLKVVLASRLRQVGLVVEHAGGVIMIRVIAVLAECAAGWRQTYHWTLLGR